MSTRKVVKYDSFKRGDTPVFAFAYTQPYAGYDWTAVQLDCAMTSVTAPSDNTGAAATRLNRTLTVDADNTATYNFQLTVAESKALTAGATYQVEAQLKESGGLYVATPVTGQVVIEQDYII